LLGGWFWGKGHWDEWHSTEAKVRAVTPIPDGLVLTGRNGRAMREVTTAAQRGSSINCNSIEIQKQAVDLDEEMSGVAHQQWGRGTAAAQ
jgi:hypothetical protein